MTGECWQGIVIMRIQEIAVLQETDKDKVYADGTKEELEVEAESPNKS